MSTVISFDKPIVIVGVPSIYFNGIHYFIVWNNSTPPCINPMLNVSYLESSILVN